MSINLQIGGYVAPQPLPGARGADIQVGQKKSESNVATVAAPNAEQSVPTVAAAEEKRYQQVVAAAKNLFKDVYVVSDKSFTIFKDASGQYITRYTSLRDGKVTYVPEQTLLQSLGNSYDNHSSLLELQA